MVDHVEIAGVVGLAQDGGHQVGLPLTDAPLGENRHTHEPHLDVVLVLAVAIGQ